MTTEKIDNAIEMLQALKKGMELEAHVGKDTTYKDVWTPIYTCDSLLGFLQSGSRIRIKQEPKYRPYNSTEEFLQASKKHGPYLICNCNKDVYEFPTTIQNDRVYWNPEKWDGMNSLLDNYTWQDGTTCGILE